MIINNNLQAIRSIYAKAALNNTSRGNDNSSQSRQADDEIVLSSTAQNFSLQLQTLRSRANDVRTDKVDELTEKINSGTYNIDAEELADKIMNFRF